MLNVANKPFTLIILNVIMLNVVALNVVAPTVENTNVAWAEFSNYVRLFYDCNCSV
jgi:hypothetical protein